VRKVKRKWLAVGIILLFIGVSVAPSINQCVVKASQNDDLVEVITQACGIKGYGDNTVKLTRQQTREIDRLFESLNNKLDKTTSREESVRVYNEVIIELSRNGLLPQGMTIDQAQRLVMGWNQNYNQRILNRQQEIFPLCVNVFCLLWMYATPNPSGFLFTAIFPLTALMIIGLPLTWLFSKLGADNLADELEKFIMRHPFKFMNLVMIGDVLVDFHSFGLKGVEQRDGDAALSAFLGYTGLIITLNEDESHPTRYYCLGSALAVI
jgi:hypothetical protein